MKLHWSLFLVLPISLVLQRRALAETIELQVLPVNGPEQSCPQKVIAYQTPQPYREGGYAVDGMVNLSAIATNITLSPEQSFSAIWVGTLKPQYQNCKGTAGMVRLQDEDRAGHSYFRLQMEQGKVKMILDMTGLQDANGYTAQILKTSIQQGNPRWTWGGTD